jgi:hypothetical protein
MCDVFAPRGYSDREAAMSASTWPASEASEWERLRCPYHGENLRRRYAAAHRRHTPIRRPRPLLKLAHRLTGRSIEPTARRLV